MANETSPPQPSAPQPAPLPVQEGDFEPHFRCSQPLTPEQVKAIRNMTYFRACLMRQERLWTEQEESAFLNGAMCAFFACGNNADVPAFWLLGPLRVLDRLARWKTQGRLQDGA